MNIASIISEYNPLHNGHKYQIELTKDITKCDGLVSIMSGNFVQRGEPAMIDKWNRTKMALCSGIDLVLELPAIYALSSAEYFAHGAISILHNLNTINSVCFGSECGDIAPLLSIAKVLNQEPGEYKILLQDFLAAGLAFPLARSKALQNFLSNAEKHNFDYSTIVSKSNNILGIEYCKSILRNNSKIKPYTIKRSGSDYNDKELGSVFSSATAIRSYLKNKKDLLDIKEHLPLSSFNIIMQLMDEKYEFIFPEDMFNYIKYKALTDYDESILGLKDAGEGLHNRIYKSILNTISLEELINAIKTKRYTYTRISRLLTQYFIGYEKLSASYWVTHNSKYVRVLGLNSRGADILREIKKCSNIEILTKIPKEFKDPMYNIDLASTRAYSVLNKKIRYNDDYLISPIIM